jgi:hypothetical protein
MFASTHMQEGKKGSTLGKRKQSEEVRLNHWAESNREVCLDATPALIVDLNVS